MSDKTSLKQILDTYLINNLKLEKLREEEKIIKNNQNKQKDLILNIIEKKYNNTPITYNNVNFICKKEVKTSTLSLKKIELLLKEYYKNDDEALNVYNYLKKGRDTKENNELIIKNI
jgi:hypothetical protein